MFLSAVLAITLRTTPAAASMFDFVREGTTTDVLAKLELVGTDPFDHAEVASFQLTSEGATLWPFGLLGTDRIFGPFSSSVNRFTDDGIGGLMSDAPLQLSTLTYRVNDACQHELDVSAGRLGMSDALSMGPTLCESPHVFVPGTWRIVLQMIPGDANGNGFVDSDDLAILLAKWEQDPTIVTAWELGDFTGNNDINDDDPAVLLANWTGPAPTGSAALDQPDGLLPLRPVQFVPLDGLAVMRRRRR